MDDRTERDRAVLDADALRAEHGKDTQLHFLIHDLTPVTG